MAVGRATGKVILTGEHFVVHGTPAIAVPLVSRGVEVRAEPGDAAWDVARAVEGHLRRLLEALGHDPGSWSLHVRSTLPVGAGLGGSAALAVALVRALDPAASVDEVQARAHELEKIAHGRPSGIDDAVAAHGCAVWFERGKGVERLDAPPLGLWVGLTPDRTSTLEAVAGVTERAAARPAWFTDLMARAHGVVAACRSALVAGDGPALGAALDDNHALLREVGVSTPNLDALVDSARGAGAWGAKLTGGGLGGAAIALAPPEVDLTEVWRRAGAVEVIAP